MKGYREYNNMTSTKRGYDVITLLCCIYPVYVFISYFQARGILPPAYAPGNGYLIWPLRLIIIIVGFRMLIRNFTKMRLFTLFFFLSIFSVVAYLYNDRPFELYAYEILYYVVPMLMFYVGIDKGDNSDRFFKSIFISWMICFAIGLYLYIARPIWYQEAFTINYNSAWFRDAYYDTNQIFAHMRFASFFFNPYTTQYFCIYLLPYSLSLLLKSDDKFNRYCYLFSSLFLLAIAMLSMQRAAIFDCLLITIVFLYYSFSRGRKASYLLFVGVIIGVIVVLSLAGSIIGEQVGERLLQMNLDDAFNESRVDQNVSTLSIWHHYLFGEGIGAAGGEARRFGYIGITDGNYTKILVEQGIVGSFLFILLLILSFFRAFKNFKYLSVECCIVGGMMVAFVGSSALIMSMWCPPFWYALGRIWNKEYLKYLKSSDNKI